MEKIKVIKQLFILLMVACCLVFQMECNSKEHTAQAELTNPALLENSNKTTNLSKTAETISENKPEVSHPYFKKGVYVNYSAGTKNPSKDYFYVFYDETSGHTDDGKVGINLPFACEQTDGTVKFSFGGADPESEDILVIESTENGKITGHFNDGKSIVFMPVKNTNPDNFDAQKYLNRGRTRKNKIRK